MRSAGQAPSSDSGDQGPSAGWRGPGKRRFRRGLVGVAFAVAVVAFGAVNVNATNKRGSLPAGFGPPASGFPGSSGPPKGAIEASRIRQARLRESWRSKAAQDERARRRRGFTGLSRGAARLLGEQQHPSVFSPKVWSPLRGVTRRGDFLDSYSTRVTLPNGSKAVAVSSLPLRARDEEGKQSPVDLDLVPRSGALAPENPLVDTVIPKRSSDPVRVGEIGFGLGGDAPVQLENNRAFYADAGGRDIDLIVMPTPSGVESFAQIRSIDAPERVRMPFDLPAGAKVRGAADGALEIVRGEEVIATVTRPSAVDAQQRPVPVEYRIEGDDLVMTVKHHSGDFAMPIMLDPSVAYGWNNNPRRYDATGWGAYQSNPASRWCSYFGDAYWGYGQYTFGRPESYQPCAYTSYSPYEIYEWTYYGEFSRHSTAFVEGWDEGYNFDVGWGGTCHYSGTYSVGLGRWETFSGNECSSVSQIRYHRSAGVPANYAVFGTVINGSGQRQNFTNLLWGATVYVSDRDNPTVEQGARRIPAGWTTDTTFDVAATDSGIGVDWTQVRLAAPNQPDYLDSRLHPCSADPANHSPRSDTFSYTTNNMPEGESTVSAQAGDLIRVPAFSEIGTIKIDRTGPTITGLPGAVRDGAQLNAGVHHLDIAAQDLGGGGTANSGVKLFEYSVDGGFWGNHSTACESGPCSTSFDIDTRPDNGLAEGEHEIRVRVTDGVTQTSAIKTIKIVVDRTPPDLAVSGDLKDSPPAQMTAGLWSLDADSREPDSSVAPSGMASVKFTVDGQPFRSEGEDASLAEPDCDDGDPRCPIEAEIAYNPKDYPDGTRQISVVAKDKAGNTREEQVPVQSHNDPPPSCAGSSMNVVNFGTSFEGNMMWNATRNCVPPNPASPEDGRSDSVNYVYGDCPTLTFESSGDGGCAPPIQVQVAPLCLKHAALYNSPEFGQQPYEPLTILGVPAASFQDGTTLEIYTGSTTITIFGIDAAQVRRAADALRPALSVDIPVTGQILSALSGNSDNQTPLTSLPQPDQQTLNSTEACE